MRMIVLQPEGCTSGSWGAAWTCHAGCPLAILLTLLCFSAGCATVPYSFGSASAFRTSPQLHDVTEPRIERGRPQVIVDSIGWVLGIPAKIVLLDRRVENHRIDTYTEAEIAAYLDDNELSTVKVRLNQYHPRDDWRRLRANTSVGAGWRYTFGALSVLGETLLPGRVFGGDRYNPWTNTIHLYSNVPAIAFHEGGHAKDFAKRRWKGTYAAVYLLPGVPLYHEAVATSDALGYVLATRDVSAQQEAYEILYPAYGTYVGNAISGPVPLGYLVGVIGGHVAGQMASRQLERSQDSDKVFTAN